MKYFIAILLSIITGKALATDAYYLVPQYVGMEVHDYKLINDPYVYPRDHELKWGGVFRTDFHLLDLGKAYIFDNNKVSFEESKVTGRILHGGWEFYLGTGYQLSEHQIIEIGKYHHSYHVFEDTRDVHFPTADSYYINMVIYKK